MNESGIVLRGGNVTITGLTIDTAAVTSNTAEQEVAAAAATLRQRTAAFNGTLGFFTLGLSIEVLGEFGLKRSMAWSYNTRMECWVTQVGVAGLFRLTRQELVNGLVVSNSTLEPMASGTLNMFSIVFPGPGFTGTYDWAGALNLVPDPFEIWGFNSLVSQRRLLEVGQHPAPGHSSTPAAAFWHDPNPHVRALLQAGDGRLPVHGRVSVREARSGPTVVIGDAPQPGSQAPIDDEIMAYNPIPPDPNNPAGYTWLEEHPSQGTPEPQLPQSIQDAFATIVRTFSDPENQRTLIIVAALVAPLGLALCAVGFAAMYVRRRRQRERKSTSASTEGGTMSKRPSGMTPPNTDVYDMQPHETGYGSVCGVNQPAMLPPSCDSSADGETSSAPMAPRSVFNTLRSSLTGMASAIGIYRGQSGDVYRVQEQRQLQNIPGGLLRGPSLDMQAQWPPQQNIPGGLLRGPSLDMQAQGWPPTLRRREPTLPGGTRRSLDAPVATVGRPAVTAALPVTSANNAAGRGRPASGPVAARLGNNAGMQMAQQRQRQQQQQGAVMQWMPQQQEGPGDAMWGTPDMQAARSGSVYNNPLAQSQSGSGAGSMEGATGFMPAGANQAVDSGFFLSGGDTLIMPSEFTLADIHDVQSQAQAAPSAPAAPSAGALRPWQRQRAQASGGAPAPFINWQ